MAYSVRVLGAATLLVAGVLTATRAGATIDATGRWVIRSDVISSIVIVCRSIPFFHISL